MENIDIKFNELTKKIKNYSVKIDLKKIKAAYGFAKIAHADDKRLSGVEMIWHPVETAMILANWQMDEDTIVAALLHDTIEHGAASEKDILDNFGKDVLELVKGVTKISKFKLVGSEEEVFVENLRKMFLAIARDLRVVFLRLAERIDNLKDLEFLPEERRVRYAKDSLEIYSILAERLGMWEAKKIIDNTAFKHAYPEDYARVFRISSSVYKDSEQIIKTAHNQLTNEIGKYVKRVQIISRKKDLFSLYAKLKRPEINWNIDNIYDVVALRIIVPDVKDCYVALGVLHEIYKPIPHLEVADYIARPKPNGYRSIHTRVLGPKGRVLEVQIRTVEMHNEAEYGAAAHWQMNILKKSGKLTSKSIDAGTWKVPDNLEWVKQLSKWQDEIKDTKEFLQAVKFDGLAKRIFALSPDGDVYDLPINSTPIDFAYSVHTDLGRYIESAKADGKIVPLNYLIQNGQVIEIIKSKHPRPIKSDWLDFVVSTVARREIKKQLRKKDSEAILN